MSARATWCSVFRQLADLSEQERRSIASPDAYLRRAADNLLRDDARQEERRSATLHAGEDAVVLRSAD